MKSDPIQITGLALIDKALEFESMTSDKSEWTLKKIKDNPPRFVRWQQLEVLLKYFTPELFHSGNIASGLENLLNGQFILLRDANKYENIFTNMDRVITSIHPIVKRNKWTLEELKYNYINLLRYKRSINNIINWHSGILEISYPYLYAVEMTERFSKSMDTKHIDEFLSLVVDPFGRTVSKNELISDFNYPKENPYNIDLDWI